MPGRLAFLMKWSRFRPLFFLAADSSEVSYGEQGEQESRSTGSLTRIQLPPQPAHRRCADE